MSRKKINWAKVREARENLARIACEHPDLLAAPSEQNYLGWIADLENIMTRGRANTLGETTQVAFRLPTALIKRLDEHVERMKRLAPGIAFTRADAVRSLLTVSLDTAEAAEAEGKRLARPKR
jgi:hypothetical protein